MYAILNIALIPKLGATGAVIGSIGAELIITILFVHFDDRYVTWKDVFLISWKKMLAGLVMLICLNAINSFINFNVVLAIMFKVTIGISVYSLVLFILQDDVITYMTKVQIKHF